LIVAALLAAAVLVPALYLVYLYEAQVYRDEPAKVLGLTMAAGVVLGVLATIISDAVLNESSPLKLSPGAGFIVGSCILLPIIQEVIKPLPVLALRGQGKFSETIDGLTFGVAAGLGFAAAESIVQFSKVIATEPVHTSSANWLFPVLGVCILTPLLQGTCTGVMVAVLWKPSRLSNPLYLMGVPVAIGGHILFSVIAQILQDNNVSSAIILFFQAAVVGGMLVYIRHLVHSALLEEAKDFGFQVVTCPHCRQTVGAAAFCPECGGAISAGPRNPVAAVAASAAPDVPAANAPTGAAAGGTAPGGANA
jgi:RsiW-degrading membrane proteinase PrsW (M82 family)